MATRRAVLGLLSAGILVPGAALAQAERKTLAVVLFAGDSDNDERVAQPFFEEMARLGWTEGTNITYERLSGRGAREYVENLAKIAADLEPHVIYATTGTLALAAVKATEKVPVIFMTAVDPVAINLVASMHKPGGNATGTYQFRRDAIARSMQLIRETFPQQKRIGAVFDRRGAAVDRQRANYADAARHAGLETRRGRLHELRGDPEDLRELPARRHPHGGHDAFVHADRQPDRGRKIRAAQQSRVDRLSR
jgi:putative ABC transport system substrate-binding protein